MQGGAVGRSGDVALVAYTAVAVGEFASSDLVEARLLAPLVGACVVLLLRHRHRALAPVVAIALAWGVEVQLRADGLIADSAGPLVLTLVGVALLAARGRRGLACAGAAALLPIATYALSPPEQGSDAVLAPAAVLVVAAASAGLTRARRQLEQAHAELDALQALGATEEAQLLADDRRQVARELHDVASHHLSIAALHASAARLRLAAGDADVVPLLRAVEDACRAALRGLLPLLDLLAPADVPAQRLAPQPSAAQLPELLRQVRDAGLHVDADLAALPPLPPGEDLVVYRVVQEALTNALRHGGGTARVAVRSDAGDVVVEVVNDLGRRRPGTGQGLVGLAERVSLYGGRLTAARAGHEWRLRAVLPLPEPSLDESGVPA